MEKCYFDSEEFGYRLRRNSDLYQIQTEDSNNLCNQALINADLSIK